MQTRAINPQEKTGSTQNSFTGGKRRRMKILVISLAGIGDTLFATPLIHELRANFPAATVDALVLWSGSKDVLEGNPHLNSVYQKNLIKSSKTESFQFLWQLRKNQYDVSI